MGIWWRKGKGLGVVHLPWELEYTRPAVCLAPSPTTALSRPNLCHCLLPGAPCQPCPRQNTPLPSLPFSLPFPSCKENRTSDSPPLAPYTHPALSSLSALAAADSLKSEEKGRRTDASSSLPAPRFWELFLDTPCRRLLHFHPQSPRGLRSLRAQSRRGGAPCPHKQAVV